MPLFTGRGDAGETDLMGGTRVSKDHARIEALGVVDELNSLLGAVLAFLDAEEGRPLLSEVQNTLFSLGAELSLPVNTRPSATFSPIAPEQVHALERAISDLEKRVGPQRAFVLPGGTPGAALLHVARAVARRAERRVVALAAQEDLNPEVVRYLNRLSSLLHALALRANQEGGIPERHPTYP